MIYFIEVLFILVTIHSGQPAHVDFDKESDISISTFNSLLDIVKPDDVSSKNENNLVCNTESCQIIAEDFIRGMNKSVDPCDDFYEYVCGEWENVNEIPGYSPAWSRDHIMQDTVNRRIKSILEAEPQSSDILPVRQAKKWYQACMDVDALEKRGIKPLESILLRVGGWPMTLDPEEWNEKEHSWQNVEHDYFHITGSYIFYNIGLSWRNNYTIKIEKGDIPLHENLRPKYRNYTGNDYDAYVSFITEVAQLFVDYNKADVTEEMIANDVRDLVEFEKQLYMLSQIEDNNFGDTTIAEFVEWYANATESQFNNNIVKFDFENLIRRKFDLVNRQINDSFPLVIDNIEYYVQLTNLISNSSTRTVVNYLHWYFISDMLIHTTESMRDAFFLLMRNEYDVKERSPRWLECIDSMKLTTASAFAFVKKYFSQEAEEAAQKMIANIRREVNSDINESTWMDEETKALAKEKINNMKIYVGFPDWYKNKTAVLNFYKGLTIGFDHFNNVLSFKKYEVKKSLRYKILQMDMLSGEDPIIVNAFYSPYTNEVSLPAANFQSPLFTLQMPPSVNYGIAGLTVAHEMGHGFDNVGIQFDKVGNSTQISEEMLKLHDERANCFRTQFNNYFGVTPRPNDDDDNDDDDDDDDHVKPSRGERTSPDNIADSTGLQSVFKAYKKLIEEHPVDNYKLPGFEEYTDNQMFFISFAAEWCGMATQKYEEKMVEQDDHSPNRLRVIGSLSNSYDFAEAFNCRKESPMNPEKKCNIWK